MAPTSESKPTKSGGSVAASRLCATAQQTPAEACHLWPRAKHNPRAPPKLELRPTEWKVRLHLVDRTHFLELGHLAAARMLAAIKQTSLLLTLAKQLSQILLIFTILFAVSCCNQTKISESK